MPLRILLFLGHLISIGVTADRVPGVPQFFSALLGIISEGFEDLHYFVSHDHHHEHEHEHNHQHTHDHQHEHEHQQKKHRKELLKERLGAAHGHNHDVDLPTRLLKFIFSPIYFMAAIWDYLTSQNNTGTRHTLEFKSAWEKQRGIAKEEKVKLSEKALQPSTAWQKEHALYRIERHKEKHLNSVFIGRDIAQQKNDALTTLQNNLRNLDPTDKKGMTELLANKKHHAIYNTHRFFTDGKTETATFIEQLPSQTNLHSYSP